LIHVSIRAPRAGGDHPSYQQPLSLTEFQSAPPARGATTHPISSR